MEGTANTKLIVLNSRPHKESDVVVDVFSKEFGRMSLLVRGAKKISSKMIGHLEVFSLSEAMIIKGKGLDYIGGAVVIKAWQGIREDFNKMFYSGKIVSLFSSLVKDNVKDERLFSLLSKYLQTIDEEDAFDKDKGALIFLKFSLSFLQEMGYRPEMNNCLACHKKLEAGGNYFDLHSGGVVCINCAKSDIMASNREKRNDLLTISDNSVIMLRYLLDLDNKLKLRISKKVISETINLINKFILYIRS